MPQSRPSLASQANPQREKQLPGARKKERKKKNTTPADHPSITLGQPMCMPSPSTRDDRRTTYPQAPYSLYTDTT
jgi:hypothetical protein